MLLKNRYTCLIVVCILGMPYLHAVQNHHDEHFLGVWKLNVAKSTYTPGPAPAALTTTVTAIKGGVHITNDSVDAQGRETHTEFSAQFDGKDYPVKGATERDSTSFTRIDDYTFEQTNKLKGSVMTRTRTVYSRDGKTRTTTSTGVNTAGQAVHNIVVYDRVN